MLEYETKKAIALNAPSSEIKNKLKALEFFLEKTAAQVPGRFRSQWDSNLDTTRKDIGQLKEQEHVEL